jgi:protein SCO1/2
MNALMVLIAVVAAPAFAQLKPPTDVVRQTELPPAVRDIGIDQKLNEQLPLDAILRDETGKTVRLRDYFGEKPVIIAPVYYTCPMLCNQVLTGLIGALKTLSFTAGKEFTVVAFSFDPNDTPETAQGKKQAYLEHYGREQGGDGIHFLTGDQSEIDKLTEAIGFRYGWDAESGQFVHASGIMVATPEGKLSRYLYGIEFAPKDLRLSLVEASQNKIGTVVDAVLLFCYHYDPSTGKYGPIIMNFIRLGGLVTFIGVGIIVLIVRRRVAARRAKEIET